MAKSALSTVVTVVVSALVAGYLFVELHGERQSVAELRERLAALELPRAQTPAVAAVEPTPSAQAAETPALIPPAAEAPALNAPAEPVLKPAAAPPRQQIVVLRPDGTPDPDPNAAARAQMLMWWGDIEKDLGFSAEEMQALLQLVARGNATPAEYNAATGGRYAELQERSRIGLTGNRVSSLQRQLASTPHPLTGQQESRLREAFLTEFRRTDEETAAYPRPTEGRALLDIDAQRLRVTEASHERLMIAARSFLAAEQVAVMQSSLDLLLNSQRRSLETRRLQLEAGGSGAPNYAPIYFSPNSATPAPAVTR